MESWNKKQRLFLTRPCPSWRIHRWKNLRTWWHRLQLTLPLIKLDKFTSSLESSTFFFFQIYKNLVYIRLCHLCMFCFHSPSYSYSIYDHDYYINFYVLVLRFGKLHHTFNQLFICYSCQNSTKQKIMVKRLK